MSSCSSAFIAAAVVASVTGTTPGPRLSAARGQGVTVPAALKIVVLEGEDAVNVVQQKTAVAPVVEVRDRNNQPVVGAVVRFAITKGRATFSGARVLTVTTNAAGRAVAAGLTPTGSGAVQIGASAAFQGQTAVATIVQTNVMTAAQASAAAAASGAGASGGASGTAGTAAGSAGAGGGAGAGVSGATVGIVGGAVAGSTLVATRLAGGQDGSEYVGVYTGSRRFIFTGGVGCVRDHAVTGTWTMRLTVTAGSVSGRASIEQSDVVTAVTCSGGPQIGATNQMAMSDIEVQGTPDQIAFSKTQASTFPPEPGAPNGGTVTVVMTFAGRLIDDAIAGSLTEDSTINPGNSKGLGTYAVTQR